MGRSKKQKSEVANAEPSTAKIFCYWCDKDFPADREDLLQQHQTSKHFMCPECGPRSTGNVGKCLDMECLVTHVRKQHKHDLDKVPNAKPGRDKPLDCLGIYGMDGVPDDVLEGWGLKKKESQPNIMPTPFLPPLPIEALPPEAPPEPTQAQSDLQQQLAEWLSKRKEEEEKQQAEIAAQDELRTSAWQQPAQDTTFAAPPDPDQSSQWSGQWAAPDTDQSSQWVAPGFTVSRPMAAQTPPAAVIAAFAETAETSRLAKFAASAQWPEQAANSSAPAPAPAPVSTRGRRSRSHSRRRRRSSSRSRSPSRRKRSRSRRSRSRSRRSQKRRGTRYSPPRDSTRGSARGGPPPTRGRESALPPAASRTIQITEGMIRSRNVLKNEMERFGRVDLCFMGNKHQGELPMVRFATTSGAELAMQAIQSGQVVVTVDGAPIKAEFKKGAGESLQRQYNHLDYTSRDLVR